MLQIPTAELRYNLFVESAPLKAVLNPEKERDAAQRAAREMRFAVLTIVFACVFVLVAVVLVVVVGHIKLF